ncbi:hypothetical protein SCORR_v1c08480 [Spiroplasma corruscae]|uniref:Uncharacterized protein n=1 Tax=Spiroplasma corruscae TaxID=216934 RepID=A0A222EQ07_9MOLU|nr:hypothetical protein [Spiroplasma corruscae]ASP28620.1 hypothetical protein SCORR_v1c08480 [Spiroplasma corruscae]
MNLPYWIILILLFIAVILYFVIPWKKIRKWRKSKRDIVNKPKDLNGNRELDIDIDIDESQKELVIKNNGQKPLYGVFNWFGSKQALRDKALVYVKEELDCCELCAPFENKIISLEKYDKNFITMSEAISKGYHHIGCKHIDINYFPNETKLPENIYTTKQKKAKHRIILDLFRQEQELRNLIYNFDNNIGDVKKKDIDNKKNAIKEYCKVNSIKYSQLKENPNLKDIDKFRYN